MVKKKTRRKVIKPPQPKLDTVFNCYKCGTKKTIEVKYNRKEKIATLRCKACGIKFETNIRPADAYIDIYYRWIDHIQEEENKNSDEESKNKSDSEEKEYDDNDEEEKEEAEDESEKEEKEEKEEKSDNEEENENDNEEKEEKDDKDDKDDEGSEKDKDDE